MYVPKSYLQQGKKMIGNEVWHHTLTSILKGKARNSSDNQRLQLDPAMIKRCRNPSHKSI